MRESLCVLYPVSPGDTILQNYRTASKPGYQHRYRRDTQYFHPHWDPPVGLLETHLHPSHPLSSITPATTRLFFISVNVINVSGIVQHIIFCGFFFFHSAWFSGDSPRLFHVSIVHSSFMLSNYSTVWLYHCMSNHSPGEGHLGCFQLWAVTNKASMNIPIWVFVWT